MVSPTALEKTWLVILLLVRWASRMIRWSLPGKEVLASLVENQAAAGQIDVRPLSQLHAAFFQRLVDGLRDFLHFRFDNRGHFVAPDSAGGFIFRRRNDIRLILIGAVEAVRLLNFFLHEREWNIQLLRNVRRNMTAANVEALVEKSARPPSTTITSVHK